MTTAEPPPPSSPSSSPPPSPPLAALLPTAGADPDDLLSRFVSYTTASGLALYPAQEEALLELMSGKHVVLNTPTGSGKSLVATALHFKALAEGKTSFYTSPIKALVNEKFFELCRQFGPERVGMMTGDASINRDAPIVCCTAEILANMALRDGAGARRLRRHGRVPLLRRPRARRGLADPAPLPAADDVPAHVGDARRRCSVITEGLHGAHGARGRGACAAASARCRSSSSTARRRCTRRSTISSTVNAPRSTSSTSRSGAPPRRRRT